MTDIQIHVKGIDELRAKFGQMPPVLRTRLARAGTRYAPYLLNVQGVKTYPPQTAANFPPVPYYIRGVGMQGATYNDNSSEQYGSRFTTTSAGLKTIIGNSASYAQYLAGEYSQARTMARIGWKKLIDAAKATITDMQRIYAEEVDTALKTLRLK